jgi:sigma-B regulation protein RsbU (phosphoserine phosphatase)
MTITVNYKRLRREGIEKTVAFETEKVNKIIAEMEYGVINLAVSGLLFYESQSYSIGETAVLEYLSGFPVPSAGGFWFEPYAYNKDTLRACIYAYFDKEKDEALLDDFNVDDYDFHSMDWYREIIDAVTRPYHAIWTKTYIDDSSLLMTTAGAGIFSRDGRLIGISILDLVIEEVVRELIAVKPTENSFVLLCFPEKDSVISSTRADIAAGASIKSIPWDINADSFIIDGVNYLRFGRYMDNGWLLSIQIPENEIFAEVEDQNNRFSMLIAFSSIAMLLLAYLLISKLINDPIKHLISDVSQLALGNLDTRIEIASNDELGQLAFAFNKMTSDLKKSIDENVRERAEKERISTELGVAKTIQASLLPCIFPPFPDRTEFDLYASMLPAREVGGDFYDFYLVNNDNLAVVIADVSGKGVPAALFMVIAKTLIKNCSSCRNPKAVFESVNKRLCEGNETDMFVTAFMGFYNIPTGRFVYVNAGHNPPLVKKRGGGYEFLKNEPCLILAWMKDAKYREEEIVLEPGDSLYLYTDGVTEAMNRNKDLFGEERLLSAVNQYKDSPPRELLYAIKRKVDIFTEGAEQADDITMLALKINNAAEAHPAAASVAAAAALDSMKELKVEARVENLDKVMDFINAELEKLEYPPELQNEIGIAVEEIFVNIVNYAYTPASGNVAVFISTKDALVIRFEDTGKPYNPLEQADPDFTKDPSLRDIGGLGVFLVKKIMDTVGYSRINNRNILVITKNHPKSR